MRVHIDLDDELASAVDELSGPRGRSAFIRAAVRAAVDQERRWNLIDGAAGRIADEGHDWDAGPAEWVRAQRRGDPRRGG